MDSVKYAYFILKNGTTVKIPYEGDLIKTSEECKKKYNEVGYLDSIDREK